MMIPAIRLANPGREGNFHNMIPQLPHPTPAHHNLVAALGCLLALALPGLSDEVSLVDGGKLSGSVVSIREGGAIDLASLLAAEPLALKGDQVMKVRFDTPPPATDASDTRIDLVNGDFITASLLDYSAGVGARVRADGIGELELPPAHLRALTLGVRPAQIIYRGPDDLANWTSEKQRSDSNWTLADERLSIDGSGRIGRMLELPDHYVIRFNLSWQGQPNFQFSFSDPLKEQYARVDRYYLQFGRAGLEIKRESSEGRQYHTVGKLNRQPDQFPNRNMDVEIRVNRAESVIYLAINGQPEGRFMDPFGNPPTADGIALVSNASRGVQHEVRNLSVRNWDETPGGTETVEPGEPTRDTVVMRQGDQYGGTLESIRMVDGVLVFSMKVSFREQPMEILGEDIAMVLFATGEDRALVEPAAEELVLQLHDRGRLAVKSSLFDGKEVRAVHPLLGNLLLARDGISALERRTHDNTTSRK